MHSSSNMMVENIDVHTLQFLYKISSRHFSKITCSLNHRYSNTWIGNLNPTVARFPNPCVGVSMLELALVFEEERSSKTRVLCTWATLFVFELVEFGSVCVCVLLGA